MLETRYGHMIHEYYVQRTRAIMEARRERLAALRTRRDAESYVATARAAVQRAFGPLPERTPLSPRVTGREEFPRFLIEKVVFESRPGFLVTGNLYLPPAAQRGKRCPGVLGVCGHSGAGKAEPLYQSFCQALAHRGFVVFIIDPISQGERRQFYPDDGGERPGLCHAHNLMGNQMVLVDEFFGTWRVWDAIRGLDYLLSRPEVDPAQVGVTGNSGGGTLTTFLTALDPRLTMAAPSCYVCSYLANLENELPADAEQNPPGVLGSGLDHVDLLLCHAPRPTIILAQEDDMFDERAARAAYEDLRHVYGLLGAPRNAAYFAGPHGHGFFRENREAMVQFFMQQAGLKGGWHERGVAPVAAERLYALPGGETRPAGSRRVFEFTAETAKTLAKDRPKLSVAALKRTAAKLLGIEHDSAAAPCYRALRFAGGSDAELNMHAQFAVETEPGVQAVVATYGKKLKMMIPPKGRLTLYVGHVSAEDDVRSVPEVRALTTGRWPLATVDPRGIGKTRACTCGSLTFFEPYGADYLYAATGEMLDECYLGRRVFDVLRTLDFLYANGAVDVRLFGRGLGSVTAAFAGLLHPAEPRVRLLHYLPSYADLTSAPLACWPLSTLLRGCLRHFDLTDVYAALGDRLTRRNPWGARMEPR